MPLKGATSLVRAVTVFGAFVMLAVSGHAASATPTTWVWPACDGPDFDQSAAELARGYVRSTLYVKLCGETKVVRGTDYDYTAVLANVGKKTFRNIEVRIYHYDPITRASKPFRRVTDGRTGPGMTAAVWKLKSLKPRHTFRVGITLPFIQHNDVVGSNLHIQISGPKVRGGFTYDVFYVP